MQRAKYIVICALLLSLLIVDYTPEIRADTGPRGDSWIIIPAAGCAAIIAGGLLIQRSSHHEQTEPITGILFNEE